MGDRSTHFQMTRDGDEVEVHQRGERPDRRKEKQWTKKLESLVATMVAAWRAVTGRDDVYLADVLASGPRAADRLRTVLSSDAQVGPYTAADLLARLDHFELENGEILKPAGDALAAGDLARFGELVDCSQQLTIDLLQNQVPQTIDLAKQARAAGAVAASAFGAGFGGSVWALVPVTAAEGFAAAWRSAYATAHGAEATGAGLAALAGDDKV